MRSHYSMLVWIPLLAAFVLASCDSATQTPPTQVATKAAPAANAHQQLQASLKALQQVHSLHIDLTWSGKYQAAHSQNGPANTASTMSLFHEGMASFHPTDSFVPQPGLPPGPITTTVVGNEIVPDQAQFDLNTTGLPPRSGVPSPTAEIKQKDNVYVRYPQMNTEGQWYSVARKNMQGEEGDMYMKPGVGQVETLLTLALSKGQLQSGSDEVVDGQKLHHIIAIFGSNAESELLAIDVLRHDPATPLNANTQHPQSRVDFWLESNTAYVHKLQMNLSYEQPYWNSPALFHTDQTITYILSKFNQSFTITPPANSIAVDNLNFPG